MSRDVKLALFPMTGLSRERTGWIIEPSEISFSGKVQNCCIFFIDMIGSTKTSAELTPAQLARYYEVFLNAIALIAKNFGAKIVKNAGDALIFYFEDAGDQKNIMHFKNVIDCGLTMGMASNALNAKMLSEKLPPIKYRISADYGQVSVARSQSSQSEDLFGPAMNNTAKINSKAKPNGLIIGQALYEMVKELVEYTFAPAEDVSASPQFTGYHVNSKESRDFINPFERKRDSL